MTVSDPAPVAGGEPAGTAGEPRMGSALVAGGEPAVAGDPVTGGAEAVVRTRATEQASVTADQAFRAPDPASVARVRRGARTGRHTKHVATGAAVVGAAVIAWIALTPLPPKLGPVDRWRQVAGPGFRASFPSSPTGSADELTAVSGSTAYVIAWFPVAPSERPDDAMGAALGRLAGDPAAHRPATLTITSLHPQQTGPFASADVTARLPNAYLHGRILVAGRRGFLAAEVGAGEGTPDDLNRFLGGFDPLPVTDAGAGDAPTTVPGDAR